LNPRAAIEAKRRGRTEDGFLGSDAEIKTTPNGKSVTTLPETDEAAA
jgi:hypothetical protein